MSESQSQPTDDEKTTGMPDESAEPAPLGEPGASPESADEPGAGAMPGIPTEGEPPTAG